MAYKVIILYQLYMPSYFLGTFTEYPEIERKNKIYVKARLIFLIGIFYSDPQLYLLKISSLLRGCLS